jgi:hypothetical protein
MITTAARKLFPNPTPSLTLIRSARPEPSAHSPRLSLGRRQRLQMKENSHLLARPYQRAGPIG